MAKSVRKGAGVSIIMPIYNSEKYLSTGIDSLISQTLDNFEIILINDGSNDKSGLIADQYALKYHNIRVIHQQNQGVSVARNVGLSVAKGKYVAFVDSDDWVVREMYEELYNAAEAHDCDIVICNILQVEQNQNISGISFPITKSLCLNKHQIQDEILPYLIKHDDLASPCNKLFRLGFIKENCIIFPKDMVLGEDYIFSIMAFEKASRVFYLPKALYNYRFVDGSTINSYNINRFNHYIGINTLKNSIIGQWNFISPQKRQELLSQWFVDKAIWCIYKEISLKGIPGIIKGYRIMKNEYVRKSVNEIKTSPYINNHFLSFIFGALVRKAYLKILFGTYYVLYFTPVVAKLRGVRE